MIAAFQRYFSSIPPVFIDGFIYVCIQMLTVLSTQIGTDESAKYVSPTALFWSKLVIGELAAGFLAVKMYRSTQYSEHLREKKNGDTQFISKPPNNTSTGP